MSLEVQMLSYSRGARRILRELSFHLESGSLTAVLGRNGSGKTTLLRCVPGLCRDYQGKILLDGTDVRTLSARELASRVSCIPQTRAGTEPYSVLDTVLMGTAHFGSVFSVPGKRELAAAREAMERVGISGLSERLYPELSGGEQQLVLIARALAQGGRCLLMDEPAASLDPGNQELLLRILRTLADQGYTVLYSTHDPQQAFRNADNVLVLREDGSARFGAPEDVLDEATLGGLYGMPVALLRTRYGTAILPKREGAE